jgi:hypothetical protein
MTNKSGLQALPSAKNLKRAFECAVRDIYEVGLTGKVSEYRTPIAQRAGTGVAGSSVDDAEKRALSDAARALAQLWKVSPSR